MAAKKSKKTAEPEAAPKLFYIFYNQERWDNWLKTLETADWEGDEDSDEMPEGFRILDGFSDDITLAVIKIIRLFQNGRIPLEEARTKLRSVEEIVMGEVMGEELAEIVGSMQVSLVVLFAAGQKSPLKRPILRQKRSKTSSRKAGKSSKKIPKRLLISPRRSGLPSSTELPAAGNT